MNGGMNDLIKVVIIFFGTGKTYNVVFCRGMMILQCRFYAPLAFGKGFQYFILDAESVFPSCFFPWIVLRIGSHYNCFILIAIIVPITIIILITIIFSTIYKIKLFSLFNRLKYLLRNH